MFCRMLSRFSKEPICQYYLRFLARIRLLRSAPTSILASLIPRPLFHGRCHGHTAGEGSASEACALFLCHSRAEAAGAKNPGSFFASHFGRCHRHTAASRLVVECALIAKLAGGI